MRKIASIFIGFAVFLFLLGFWVPLKGEWLDRSLSSWAGRHFGVLIEFKQLSFFSWSRLDFRSLRIQPHSSKNFLKTGSGKIHFRAGQYLVNIGQASFDLNPWIEEPAVIDGLRAALIPKKEPLIRLLECASEEIRLVGGAKFSSDGRLQKIHVLVFFPESSKRFRITLSQNVLMVFKVVNTAESSQGTGRLTQPVFQAQWKSAH